MYLPYKTSTDRLNPFAGSLGNYSVIMGNTGGDNRVEFGTRPRPLDGLQLPEVGQRVSFDAAYPLGQNSIHNNDDLRWDRRTAADRQHPGSGNLFLNCDDGGSTMPTASI